MLVVLWIFYFQIPRPMKLFGFLKFQIPISNYYPKKKTKTPTPTLVKNAIVMEHGTILVTFYFVIFYGIKEAYISPYILWGTLATIVKFASNKCPCPIWLMPLFRLHVLNFDQGGCPPKLLLVSIGVEAFGLNKTLPLPLPLLILMIRLVARMASCMCLA